MDISRNPADGHIILVLFIQFAYQMRLDNG